MTRRRQLLKVTGGAPVSWVTSADDLLGFDGESWSPRALQHLAELCQMSYRSHRIAKQVGSRMGYKACGGGSRRGAQFMMFCGDRFVVIALRGSSEPLDWLHDLLSVVKVRWKKGRSGRVGLGGRIQARRILPGINACLRGQLPKFPDAKIIITGHSLGGQLTELIAADLAEKYADRMGPIVPISPPRPADGQWFETHAYRGPVWTVGCVDDEAAGRPVVDLVMRVPKSGQDSEAAADRPPPGVARPSKDFRHRFECDRGFLVLLGSEVALWGESKRPWKSLVKGGGGFSGSPVYQLWQELRGLRPTSWGQAVRILGRLRRGIASHSLARVINRLGREAERD